MKPRVYISRCITFAAVRYNGQMVPSEFVDKLRPFIEPVTHCPEEEIGLGIPRAPVRIIALDKEMKDLRLVQPATGKDHTDKMRKYTDRVLSSLGEIDGFIMKSKSPSSGVRDVKIYPKYPDGAALTKKGAGFFGGEVLRRFPDRVVEDEGRLNDEVLRDNFLKCIFLSAGYRGVRQSGRISSLIKFQERNKLLLMSYNQDIMRKLGRISANAKKIGFDKSCEEYGELLGKIMFKPYKKTNLINSYEHAFGYFKTVLAAPEKAYFISCLKKYASGKTGSVTIITLLKSYIIRFDEKYLAGQSLFEPYPEELLL